LVGALRHLQPLIINICCRKNKLVFGNVQRILRYSMIATIFFLQVSSCSTSFGLRLLRFSWSISRNVCLWHGDDDTVVHDVSGNTVTNLRMPDYDVKMQALLVGFKLCWKVGCRKFFCFQDFTCGVVGEEGHSIFTSFT
jgi:hypothetical protein